MRNENLLAKKLLLGTGISTLDAARLIRNVLDEKNENCTLTALQFCGKIIEVGKRHIRFKNMSIENGFALYLGKKSHLRIDSLNDIKYLGRRLLKSRAAFAKTNFSELTLGDCESWLSSTFTTPSQFNKARTMLHGLFEFAMRHEWCERNIIKLVEKRKVIEKEIKPLKVSQTRQLLETVKHSKNKDCTAAVGLLVLAGIRPKEVRRIKWNDIDLEENIITVRSECSKTGGVRHVEICPALKLLLKKPSSTPDSQICPQNWTKRWKNIRDDSGFKGMWVQDVLRHTYASYHAKYFCDFSRLQINMGHYNQSLLRSRYVNMYGISKQDAKEFFISQSG